MEDGSIWVFSSGAGRWIVGILEKEKDHFKCTEVFVATTDEHGGWAPHEVDGWSIFVDGIWQEAPNTRVGAEGSSLHTFFSTAQEVLAATRAVHESSQLVTGFDGRRPNVSKKTKEEVMAKELKAVFRAIDVEATGSITPEGIAEAMRVRGFEPTPERLENFFAACGAGNAGLVPDIRSLLPGALRRRTEDAGAHQGLDLKVMSRAEFVAAASQTLSLRDPTDEILKFVLIRIALHRLGLRGIDNEALEGGRFTKQQEAELQEAFDLLDVDESGAIDLAEFESGMLALGFEPSDVVHKLFASADDDGDGLIDYDLFVRTIGDRIQTRSAKDVFVNYVLIALALRLTKDAAPEVATAEAEEDSGNELEEQPQPPKVYGGSSIDRVGFLALMMQKIRARDAGDDFLKFVLLAMALRRFSDVGGSNGTSKGLNAEQKEELIGAFNLLDTSSSGAVDVRELEAGMRGLGFDPSQEDLDRFFDEVDADRSGAMGRDEFMRTLPDRIQKRDLKDVVLKFFLIAMALRRFAPSGDAAKGPRKGQDFDFSDEHRMELEETFDLLDTDKSGCLSARELSNAMQALGFRC